MPLNMILAVSFVLLLLPFASHGREEARNIKFKALPKSWDWEEKGVVCPVQNQGEHGAVPLDVLCALEGYQAVQSGKYVPLSWYELVDCCGPFDEGEDLLALLKCILEKMKGTVCTAASYPAPRGKCEPQSCDIGVTIKTFDFVLTGNETNLQVSVLKTPVVASIDASHISFQEYVSGVYSDPDCSSHQLDHTVLVVGYGVTDSGLEYWKCQNTWGENWGMKGYIYIARNKGNMCGISSFAIFPQ